MDALQRLEAIARGLATGASQTWAAASDWIDRLDTDAFSPLLPVGVVLFVLWAAMLMIPAPNDERARSYWSHFAASGRWIVLGASLVPVVVWAATRR
jgi:hypothetical protein